MHTFNKKKGGCAILCHGNRRRFQWHRGRCCDPGKTLLRRRHRLWRTNCSQRCRCWRLCFCCSSGFYTLSTTHVPKLYPYFSPRCCWIAVLTNSTETMQVGLDSNFAICQLIFIEGWVKTLWVCRLKENNISSPSLFFSLFLVLPWQTWSFFFFLLPFYPSCLTGWGPFIQCISENVIYSNPVITNMSKSISWWDNRVIHIW